MCTRLLWVVDDHLLLVEFAYNNGFQVSISMTLFKAFYSSKKMGYCHDKICHNKFHGTLATRVAPTKPLPQVTKASANCGQQITTTTCHSYCHGSLQKIFFYKNLVSTVFMLQLILISHCSQARLQLQQNFELGLKKGLKLPFSLFGSHCHHHLSAVIATLLLHIHATHTGSSSGQFLPLPCSTIIGAIHATPFLQSSSVRIALCPSCQSSLILMNRPRYVHP